MKLHYWKGAPNFGDALNPWLWPRLLPSAFDSEGGIDFIGIGTLLDAHKEQEWKLPKRVVFGSGVGYGPIPKITERWKIYAVRGPRSAKALGLDLEVGITDPAILLRQIYKAAPLKKYQYSFMPHWQSNLQPWKELCEDCGIHWVDPLAPVEQVLEDLAASEVLFAEAMHGAICADALRVPWVAISTNKNILEFKWQDWTASLGLDYSPELLPSMGLAGLRSKVQRFFSPPNKKIARARMLELKDHHRPQLSADKNSQSVEERLLDKLELLKRDLAAGHI